MSLKGAGDRIERVLDLFLIGHDEPLDNHERNSRDQHTGHRRDDPRASSAHKQDSERQLDESRQHKTRPGIFNQVGHGTDSFSESRAEVARFSRQSMKLENAHRLAKSTIK